MGVVAGFAPHVVPDAIAKSHHRCNREPGLTKVSRDVTVKPVPATTIQPCAGEQLQTMTNA